MISLDEHESQKGRFYRDSDRSEPRPNGIACPSCGDELLDSAPAMVLLSKPPKKNIHCARPGCDFRSYRTA